MADISQAEARLKRLRMRAWRRGMREMDLILGQFADAHLSDLDAVHLDTFEALLSEMDQDLFDWVTGRQETPLPYQDLIHQISPARS